MRRVLSLLLLLSACGGDDDGVTPRPDAGGGDVDAGPVVDGGSPDATPGPPTATALPRMITSVAGYGRHDGPIASAWIGVPQFITTLPDGSLLMADGGYNAIRRIDQAGLVSTIAGTWRKGYGGDGGRATEATLALAYGGELVVGPDTLIYVSDFGNHRVRAINPTANSRDACGGVTVAAGEIETIAGTGEPGFAGEGTPALEAQLEFPRGLTFWNGDLVFADIHNNRVRRLVCDTGDIETAVGSGDYGFVEEDDSVSVYHPDGSMDVGDGEAFGDGGAATDAIIDTPSAVAVAPDGALLVAEWGSSAAVDGYGVIRRVDPDDGTISTVAGNRTTVEGDSDEAATLAGFGGNIKAMVFDENDNMFVAETYGRVRRVSPDWTTVTRVMGDNYGHSSGDVDHPASEGHLVQPAGVVFRNGNLFVADAGSGWIRYLEPGADGIGPDSLVRDLPGSEGPKLPYSMGIDRSGEIFLGPNGDPRVLGVNRQDGEFYTLINEGNAWGSGATGLARDAEITPVNGIAADEQNNLFVCDFLDGLLRVDATTAEGDDQLRARPTSSIHVVAAVDAPFADHLAVGGGMAYIADPVDGFIWQVVLETGQVTKLAGSGERDGSGSGGPAADAALGEPEGLVIDEERGMLWAADSPNQVVWRIDLGSTKADAIPVIGAYEDCPGCSAPRQVAIAGGYLFIGDNNFGRVVRMDLDDPTFAQATITGPTPDGVPGFGEDEVLATATVTEPSALAVGPDGKLYVAEIIAGRVRRIGSVDILPTDRNNRVDPKSTTPVPVAFLSSYAFDATTVKPDSVVVGGAPALAGSSTSDVDRDGRPDLIVTIDARELVVAPGAKEVAIEASTTDGADLVDADFIELVE